MVFVTYTPMNSLSVVPWCVGLLRSVPLATGSHGGHLTAAGRIRSKCSALVQLCEVMTPCVSSSGVCVTVCVCY